MGPSLANISQRAHRPPAIATLAWTVVDSVLVALSVVVAAWLRQDLRLEGATAPPVGWFALAAAALYVVIGVGWLLAERSHERGSFEEVLQVTRSVALLAGCLVVLRFATGWFPVPRSLPLLGPLIALTWMFTLRFLIRSYRWGRHAPREGDRPTIVVGAGAGGRQLLRALRTDTTPTEHGRIVPLALLDDDPRKARWRIEGVRVRGGINQLEAVAASTGATTLVLAIPSASAEMVRNLQDHARPLGLELLTLPPVNCLLGPPTSADLRQLNLEDLLGRRSVTLDSEALTRTITGKRVLITRAPSGSRDRVPGGKHVFDRRLGPCGGGTRGGAHCAGGRVGGSTPQPFKPMAALAAVEVSGTELEELSQKFLNGLGLQQFDPRVPAIDLLAPRPGEGGPSMPPTGREQQSSGGPL